MNQFLSPYTIKATGVTSALLEAKIYDTPGRVVPLTVVQNNDGTATLSTTEQLATAVWRLRVKAECGCFSQLVYTLCLPPSHGSHSHAGTGGSTHTGTGGTPTPIPSC